MNNEIWVCEKCGSEDVLEKAWVKTNKYPLITSEDIEFCAEDDEDRFCNDCGESTSFCLKEDYARE